MANDTGTVELPTEQTTEEALAETQGAVYQAIFGKEEPEVPQKSEVQEPATEPATEEQPPQETETPSEAETLPAAETTEEDEPEGLAPEVQASIDKRIAKVVAKRKELEEQLSEREARVAELEAKVKELAEAPKDEPAPQATPAESDPILQVPEINKIWNQEKEAERAYRDASEFHRLLRRDPDATLAKLKELTKRDFADVDEAKDWLEVVKENASVTRNQFATQRGLATQRHVQKLETESEKHHAEALKAYPTLLDKNSKEGKVAQEILKRFPLLLNPVAVPGGILILGDLVAGRLTRESKGAAKPVPKAPPPKLAAPAATATTAARPNGKPAVNALKQKAVSTGEQEDVVRFLENVL